MDAINTKLRLPFDAVETRDLVFSYDDKSATVLKHVSINVKEGTIYGLLGPSGCGKTSLLRCILGQLTPNSGTVRVQGLKPGSPGSSIPGPGAGFMPQEVALYDEFTIEETIAYFGKLHGMSQLAIWRRTKFLLSLLGLTAFKSNLVRTLSGGQKRRLSLAAAAVHSPPLLILDEPTVGIDPLLRETYMGPSCRFGQVRANHDHDNDALHRRSPTRRYSGLAARWVVNGRS
ncbi:ABC transporter G family member 23 [Halotydeus destructor]|nr:ABC transporter G family member 23 [Halotydeus destructor]